MKTEGHMERIATWCLCALAFVELAFVYCILWAADRSKRNATDEQRRGKDSNHE